MRRNFTGFVLLIVVLAACATPAEPVIEYQTGVHLQGTYLVPALLDGIPAPQPQMEYLLYLPDGYGEDPAKEWPLIYFLHGSGANEYDSVYVMSYGLPQVLLQGDQPDNFEFIVVSPQAFPGTGWWYGNELAVLDGLLQEVIDTYQVDESRVYLTGLSMGGYGSWFMATRYPDRFAAMVSISGSGYQDTTLPANEVLCQLSNTPVWAIHGANDQISEAALVQPLVEGLDARCPEADVTWTLYPDENHFTTFNRAYRDPALYDWMLQHSR